MQLNWPDCAWVAQHTAVGIQPKGTKHPITGAAAFRKMKAWSSTELNMGNHVVGRLNMYIWTLEMVAIFLPFPRLPRTDVALFN